ncbi:MAG TPA: acyl-CoA dehydrogenase family protein [Stellaceae bacterium]|nr:acyl-CoA dehydrogenase family protein [Stellaceae bacterium]
MSEMRALLVETARRAMRAPTDRLWSTLEEAGLTRAAIAEAKGGVGSDFGDWVAILRVVGEEALMAPLAETMLASVMLSEAGLDVPTGKLTLAPVTRGALPTLARAGSGWRLSGATRFVPWAREASFITVVAEFDGRLFVARAGIAGNAVTRAENVAGEPRDEVELDALDVAEAAPAPFPREAPFLLGALARAATMAGALDAVRDLTVRYCGERQQFGRPIGKFQAIQQQVAELAAHVAAAGAAVDAAASAAERAPAPFEIAVAKARASEAAGLVAATAHQVHGAMGFTREHRLNLFTRRLWAWREDFGDECFWWSWLGRIVARRGGDGFWPFLASTDKAAQVPFP